MAGLTTVLPNNYNKNKCPYYYKIAEGSPTSHFLNFDTPISGVTFSNLRLSVFDVAGVEVISDVWPLSKVDITGGYRVYIDNMEIDSLISKGIYRLVIYDTTTSLAFHIFNWFQFRLGDNTDDLVYISYRNSTNLFNINYEELPTYRNEFFIDLNQIENEPEYDLTDYLEASTGYLRNQKSQLRDSYTLEGYFFDKSANDGMKAFCMHDDIEINFRPYQIKEGYQIETNIRNNVSKGTFEVWDQLANETNLKG